MSSLKRYLSDPKGSAMVLAVIISVVLLVLVIIGITLVRQQSSLVAGSRHKSQAFSVAEAGLDAAVWRLERSQSIEDGTILAGSNTQGNYSVLIKKPEKDAGNDFFYQVTSTGTDPSTGIQKSIVQDVYYINLSRSIYTYGGANGGGSITGNVNIQGPFYTNGDLTLTGTTAVDNLAGTSGNPLMIRGDLNLESGSVNVGSESSPMAVFVKGAINEINPDEQVHDVVSRQVPEVALPEVVRTQFLDSAQANNNSVYSGDLTLSSDLTVPGDSNINFGNFDYVGKANNQTADLTVDGVVYIDGDLTISKKDIEYFHTTTPNKATIFVNGKMIIESQILSNATYPTDSVLAFVNEDRAGIDDDIFVDVSGGNTKKIKAFLYSGGRITINKQITINGTIMATWLQLNQVPNLIAPSESAKDNFPTLFPGKDLAFLITANWREVTVAP